MGGAVFPPCCLTWDQTTVEVMKIKATSFKGTLYVCTVALSAPDPQQATTDPCICWRLLGSHGQVWVSLFWGHCSFLLGPGAHKVLFVPSKSLFPQSCVNSNGSMVGLMATSSKRAYAIVRSAAPRVPAPVAGCCWPTPPHSSTQRHVWLTLCGAPGMHKVFFEPSEHLWWVWCLILNVILPLLPSCWGFSFALGCGVSFFGRIQNSPGYGCSVVSCNFGVLAGEDEHMSCYSTIL